MPTLPLRLFLLVRMFPDDRGHHTGHCRSVSHVVWVLQSGVIILLRGTLNVASYDHREYFV